MRPLNTNLSVKKLLWILAIMTPINLFSQFNNSIFWMHDLPQSAYSNIAMQPGHDFYLGIPGLSSLYLGLNNTGFSLQNIVSKDVNNNRYVDQDKLMAAIGEQNNITMDYYQELIGFGFSRGASTFGFSATEKIGLKFVYSSDFIRFINSGNQYFIERDMEADFSGTGLEMMHYREFAFGYSRQITDYLRAGVRSKLLFGMANVWTEIDRLSIYTDPSSIEIIANTDFLAHISGPLTFTNTDNNDVDFQKYLSNTRNRGLAFDLGLAYQPIEKLTFSFNVIDIGSIHWKDNIENIALRGEFTFNGFNISELIEKQEQNILDSLKQELNYTESANTYRTSMTPSILFSAAYDIDERRKLSILAGSRYHTGRTHRTLSAAYQQFITERACFITSYSIIHGNYSNLGVGMSINLGLVQVYFLSNNIIGMMRPHTLQALNIHFGLNLVWGHQHRSNYFKPHFRLADDPPHPINKQ